MSKHDAHQHPEGIWISSKQNVLIDDSAILNTIIEKVRAAVKAANAPLTEDQIYQRARLVSALRYGGYSQQTGSLRGQANGGASFCCLGVACDIQPGRWYVYAVGETAFAFNFYSILLDLTVRHDVGANAFLCKVYGFTVYETGQLAQMNDSWEDFYTISDAIESLTYYSTTDASADAVA